MEVTIVKKAASLLCIILVIFLLMGCEAKPQPIMPVSNGAFILTPQEYIDHMNNVVEDQNDSRYLSIPEFEESDKTIDIDWIDLTLTLSTNSDGKIEKIQYKWHSSRTNADRNVNLYLSATIYMTSASSEVGQAVFDNLDIGDSRTPKYSTSYTTNGVQYEYSVWGYGEYNTITIYPEAS